MAFHFIGSVKLENDADHYSQELLTLKHYSSLITQKMVLDAREKCKCTKEQLHGLGNCCKSCSARRDLNRVISQYKQAKKLGGY